MKTIFHDKESGTKLEMEGTFANSKAQLLDNEGDILAELEGSYSEILETFKQLSYEDTQETEEPLTNSDFCGTKVKVLEDIEDKSGDILKKGTITTDVAVVGGDILLVDRVIVRPNDFNKLEILTDEQEDIQEGELFVVNNDEMEYYLGFDKGEIVKFLFHKEEGLPLEFKNSQGIEQGVKSEDVTKLENQEGNRKRFDFCAKNDILFTEDTNLEETKVSLKEDNRWIGDDGSLIIREDCEDGIPYVVSTNSRERAYVDLSNLKLRTEEDVPNLKVGDYVKVKEGKEYSGAKGFAIVADIEGNNIYLKGIDANSKYRETWINNVSNVIKIG